MATDVERFDLLGFGVTLLGDTLDAGFSVQEWRAPPRVSGIPVHLHQPNRRGLLCGRRRARALARRRRADTRAGLACAGASRPAAHVLEPERFPATYLTVMSPAGFEKYLVDLASGLRRVATGEDAAALREHLSEAYDIAVVGPPLSVLPMRWREPRP